MKIVSEELVFPYPQNWQFLALRAEKAVNAKKHRPFSPANTLQQPLSAPLNNYGMH